MTWTGSISDVAIDMLVALALTALVAMTTDIPYVLPLAVFAFSGPVSGLIRRTIVSRNPLYTSTPTSATRSWIGFVTFLAISIVVASVVTWYTTQDFWKSFAYVSMLVAFAQAVNGIVIEVEDSSPGGWLRPDTWKKE